MPEGWTARVLYLHRPDGTVELYLPLSDYFKATWTRSSSWQDTAAQAVGLLWDYAVVTRARRPNRNQRDFFRDFAVALATGTIQTNASDATGLFWPATGYKRCKGLIKAIEGFAAWCDYEKPGSSPIAPVVVPLVPGTGEHVTAMLRRSRQSEMSMLKHISHALSPTTTRKSVVDHGASPSGHAPEPVKFFPPEECRIGCCGMATRSPERNRNTNIFHRYNVRNMMIALLDGWGGLRRSEGLHTVDPGCRGGPLTEPRSCARRPSIILRNSKAVWLNSSRHRLGGRVAHVERNCSSATYKIAAAQRGHAGGSYHVGWKGMDLDQKLPGLASSGSTRTPARCSGHCIWGYLKYVRHADHGENGLPYGRPRPSVPVRVSPRRRVTAKAAGFPASRYWEGAYERSHEVAVIRIGLQHRKYLGTTTYGLRHLYGQTLANLGVSPQVIKKGLHHRNYLSQVPYTVAGNAKTNEQLRLAQEMIASGKTRAVAPIASSTAEALRKISEFVSGGGFYGRY